MAHHKLIFEEEDEDDYTLIAIHCSEEPYKLAFLLNKYLNLRLYRKRLDLDFSKDGLDISYPLFSYEDEFKYRKYTLVANLSRTVEAHFYSSGGLFRDLQSEKVVFNYLLPEFKKVDFFLKVENESMEDKLHEAIFHLNNIEQIISAYPIDNKEIKSLKNLIFD